ncbi:MAG: hypothetical protein FJX70_07630 [Alphaproteobacteria bacterium]|nr:hypothetical protein [Alphaproteobacteria bacterium]
MFIDVPLPGSVARIIRPCNVEEKLRKTFFPDKIKKITISVLPVEEFLDAFPLPKDCQKIVMLHMLVTINELLEKSNFNDKELLELVLGYSSKIFLMSPEILSETKKINFIKEWKKLKKKYSHNQTTLEKLEEVCYFITYLQYSEPIIKKKSVKLMNVLKGKLLCKKQNSVKI